MGLFCSTNLEASAQVQSSVNANALAEATHTIKAGETFYSIARKYNLTTTELQRLNPQVKPEHIEVGKSLNVAVPMLQSNRSTVPNTSNPQQPYTFKEYKVKRKDTLYSLAKNNGITVEELINANPILKENSYKLKKGMIIRIPVASTASTNKTSSSQPQYKGLSSIKVAVMLPFIGSNVENERSVEFYRGMLLGIEALKEKQTNVNITVYNEPAPNAGVALLMNDILRQKPDVIVGPLYPSHFDEVTTAANGNCKVAIPFSSKVNQVNNNPHVYVINTPVAYETALAIDLFTKSFTPQTNVIILQSNNGNKRVFCNELQRKLKSLNFNVITTAISSSTETLKSLMAGHTHEPFMLIPDDASAETLKSLLPKIQTLNSSLPQAELSLLGYDQWIPYTENDLKMQLHAADTYILTSSYYYPHTSAATAFDQSYKQWFKTSLLNSQPRMAPLGYDFSLAFLGGLATFGHDFNTQKPMLGTIAATPKLQTDLRFLQVNNKGGYISRSMWLVHFKKDLSIVKTSMN